MIIKISITTLLLLIVFLFPIVILEPNKTNHLPIADDWTIIEQIINYSIDSGIDYNISLRIAKCESNLGTNNISKTSSAKGVFQFLDGTWDYIWAEWDQLDHSENIKQFTIWYPKFPSWWECK